VGGGVAPGAAAGDHSRNNDNAGNGGDAACLQQPRGSCVVYAGDHVQMQGFALSRAQL